MFRKIFLVVLMILALNNLALASLDDYDYYNEPIQTINNLKLKDFKKLKILPSFLRITNVSINIGNFAYLDTAMFYIKETPLQMQALWVWQYAQDHNFEKVMIPVSPGTTFEINLSDLRPYLEPYVKTDKTAKNFIKLCLVGYILAAYAIDVYKRPDDVEFRMNDLINAISIPLYYNGYRDQFSSAFDAFQTDLKTFYLPFYTYLYCNRRRNNFHDEILFEQHANEAISTNTAVLIEVTISKEKFHLMRKKGFPYLIYQISHNAFLYNLSIKLIRSGIIRMTPNQYNSKFRCPYDKAWTPMPIYGVYY